MLITALILTVVGAFRRTRRRRAGGEGAGSVDTASVFGDRLRSVALVAVYRRARRGLASAALSAGAAVRAVATGAGARLNRLGRRMRRQGRALSTAVAVLALTIMGAQLACG
ncbi:hypothetical protein [Nocardia sp. GTS18]|uniref:hypothetical protein n=1 Tax=Nocardia sp. GTS18 TaxID=1778064 RepID=UPI0015EFCB7D|nr:hypothetical protein [Nocardia sp. GTS18]